MAQVPLANSKFLCVEYPGRVKHIDRALETLGGEEALVTALENPKKSVELRLRPNDPFSHPIVGDMKNTPTILLKVTRRRKKNDPDDEGTIETKAIGVVTRTCRFRGMSDFQYILPAESRMMQLRRSLEKGNVKKIIAFREQEDKDVDNVPPPIFSTRETPFPYEYTQNKPVIRVRVRQGDGTYVVKSLQRHQREGPIKAQIPFSEPTVPTEASMRLEDMSSDEQRVAAKVAELFKERPAWTRNGLKNGIDEKDHKWLRSAMYIQCYTFTTGPWRDCYFPFGVDPRTNPLYAKYQQLDTRRSVQHRRLQPTTRAPNTRDLYRQKPKQGDKEKEKKRSADDRQRHIFDGKRLPGDSTVFMLCDIVDPDFQRLIHAPEYKKSKCTRLFGFYYSCVHERLRTLLKKKCKQLLDQGTADPIPNADEGMAEAVAKEKSSMQDEEDEEAYEALDDMDNFGLWGNTDDPDTAKMLETLRQAGALGLGMEDIDQLEEYDLDEFGDEGQGGDEGEEDDDEEGNEDEPLWKLGDLGDL